MNLAIVACAVDCWQTSEADKALDVEELVSVPCPVMNAKACQGGKGWPDRFDRPP